MHNTRKTCQFFDELNVLFGKYEYVKIKIDLSCTILVFLADTPTKWLVVMCLVLYYSWHTCLVISGCVVNIILWKDIFQRFLFKFPNSVATKQSSYSCSLSHIQRQELDRIMLDFKTHLEYFLTHLQLCLVWRCLGPARHATADTTAWSQWRQATWSEWRDSHEDQSVGAHQAGAGITWIQVSTWWYTLTWSVWVGWIIKLLQYSHHSYNITVFI